MTTEVEINENIDSVKKQTDIMSTGEQSDITTSDTQETEQNIEYKAIYRDIRESYTKRLIGTTEDYIIEFDAENYLAYVHNRLSPEYKWLSNFLGKCKALQLPDVYKDFPQGYPIMKHILEHHLPKNVNKWINLEYMM